MQVVDLSLLPHADVTLYIELKPVLPPEAYITGDVRELVGGMVLCSILLYGTNHLECILFIPYRPLLCVATVVTHTHGWSLVKCNVV
jgi:hypothetical protein